MGTDTAPHGCPQQPEELLCPLETFTQGKLDSTEKNFKVSQYESGLAFKNRAY